MVARASVTRVTMGLLGFSAAMACVTPRADSRGLGGRDARDGMVGEAGADLLGLRYLRVVEVRAASRDERFGAPSADVVLSSWVSPPPERNELYAVIDTLGYRGDARVLGAAEPSCERCPRFASFAVLGVSLAADRLRVAIGPAAAGALRRARIVFVDPSWIARQPGAAQAQRQGQRQEGAQWARVFAVDLDGDGEPEIEQRAQTHPTLTYEVRIREEGRWRSQSRWTVAHAVDALDADDGCLPENITNDGGACQ